MSRSKDLLKNTGILMIGKVSTQFVSFFLLPLYTNKLSTGEYGILDIYTTIASILIPVLTLQLEQGVFRFLITSEKKKEEVLSSTTMYLAVTTLLATCIFFPIANTINLPDAGFLYGYYASNMIYVVVIQLARGEGNNILYSFASFFSSVLIIIFNIIFLLIFNLGVNGILLSHIIAYIVTIAIVLFTLKSYRYIKLRFVSWICLKSLLQYSAPLVFNQVSSWIINYSDRLIIMAILDMSANGIYALANKFFSVLITMFNIYNMAWTELVAKSIGDSDKNSYFRKVINLTIQIYLLLCMWVIAALGVAFKFLINESYYEAYKHIPILVLAAVFSGLSATMGSVYIGHKKTKSIGVTTMAAAVVNVIVHLSLIGFVGLYAASISTLIAFAALFVYRVVGLRRIEPIKIDIKCFAILLPLFGVVWGMYLTEILMLQFCSVLLALLASWLVLYRDKEMILSFIESLKRN